MSTYPIFNSTMTRGPRCVLYPLVFYHFWLLNRAIKGIQHPIFTHLRWTNISQVAPPLPFLWPRPVLERREILCFLRGDHGHSGFKKLYTFLEPYISCFWTNLLHLWYRLIGNMIFAGWNFGSCCGSKHIHTTQVRPHSGNRQLEQQQWAIAVVSGTMSKSIPCRYGLKYQLYKH